MIYLTRPEFITSELELEFQTYATSKYPEEACAFVIENKLVPVDNIHDNPTEHFELSTASHVMLISGKVQAFLHSHPDGDMTPSTHDMQSQIACAIPFGVCMTTAEGSERIVWWGDHLLDVPLLDRPFIHGAFDCYSLLRATFKQERNIVLPDFPREDCWWDGGEDVITKYLDRSGFVPVTKDIQKYDAYLMKFHSYSPPQHIAINYGDGMIIHHLQDQISKLDYGTRYAKFIVGTYRYNG